MFVKTLLLLASTVAAAPSAPCTTYRRIVTTTCAQSCLGKMVGICPIALVVKAGHLVGGTCADVGFTVANGTITQKAGPCGKITFDDFLKPSLTQPASNDIPLVTFDGSDPATTFTFETVDDPVMGGKSHSTWSSSNSVGTWVGSVAIVPFLHSPGFCTIRTTSGPQFANVTGTTKFKMMARNNATSKLQQFSLQLMTKGGVAPDGRQGTYSGAVTVPNTGEWVAVEANWADFELQWRGEPVKGPKLMDQLDQLTQLGLSTFFPGKVGTFDLDIKEFSAGN